MESRLLYCIFEDIHLRTRTQIRNLYTSSEFSQAHSTPLGWRGGILGWPRVLLSNLLTNLLLQVRDVKNIKPLSKFLLLKVDKCVLLHPIVWNPHRVSPTEQLTSDTFRLTIK